MPFDHTNDISFVMRALTGDGVAGRFDPARLRRFLEELFRWNPRLGLVSKRDTPRVVVQLIRQSVGLLDFVLGHTELDPSRTRCRVADLGTGGGFPGMVWALVEPRFEMTLIERKVRKCAFLERAAAKTGCTGLEVVAVDLADAAFRTSMRGGFDLVAMLAVSHSGAIADSVGDLLATGSYFATIRSGGEPDPPEEIGGVLKRHAAELTGDGWLVVYRKITH